MSTMTYAQLTDAEKLRTWLDYTPTTDDMERIKRAAIRKFRKQLREA